MHTRSMDARKPLHSCQGVVHDYPATAEEVVRTGCLGSWRDIVPDCSGPANGVMLMSVLSRSCHVLAGRPSAHLRTVIWRLI